MKYENRIYTYQRWTVWLYNLLMLAALFMAMWLIPAGNTIQACDFGTKIGNVTAQTCVTFTYPYHIHWYALALLLVAGGMFVGQTFNFIWKWMFGWKA